MRRAISVTGQDVAVDDLQTGEENLRIVARLYGLGGRRRRDGVVVMLTRRRFLQQLDTAAVERAIARAETRTSGEIRVSISRFFVGSSRHLAERAFKRLGMHATQARNGVLLLIEPARREVVVLGDAGKNLGDSMYDGTIYIGGEPQSLGVDAVWGEMTDLDKAWLTRKLKMYDLLPKGGVGGFRKIVAGKQLWNYDNLEPTEKKLIL